MKKGGAQQGRILQQPGGHLDGEPALPADAAAQPPLGPGVHLHLGCDVLAQGLSLIHIWTTYAGLHWNQVPCVRGALPLGG